jgi:hypothetical protein
MPNYNSETGISYGVISGNSLDSDLLDDLMHGNEAQNLSYMAAVKEARAEAESQWDEIIEEIREEAGGGNFENADERDAWIETETFKRSDDLDHDDWIERELERFGEEYEGDEEVYEGVYEGVSYHLSWLGGAIIVFISHSPHIVMARDCSICVPGAGDLDHVDPDNGTTECYDVPADWRHKA